jgi:hypothetical protein
MSYNCANLILADQEIYHDQKLYQVSTLETKENPYDIPENWSVLSFAQIDFELMVIQTYSIFEPIDIVYNDANVPQYLVGEFSE